MSQTFLPNIPAFDAAHEFSFSFQYQGNQAFYNTLTIKNNVSNAVVYEQTQETMKLKHRLPANALINGQLYNAQITVLDKDRKASVASNKIVFYCYTTPVFVFSDIVPNTIVHSPSLSCKLSYTQTEGEVLNSYQITIYDLAKKVFFSSGARYDDTLTSLVGGLGDNEFYYLRGTGETLNHMVLDTGYIPISCEYTTPSAYSLLWLENQPEQASIKISVNIIDIKGSSTSPPVYIEQKMVDLTSNGQKVWFDKGFSIKDDFLLQIKGKGFLPYQTICELNNGISKIVLSYHLGIFKSQGDIEKGYFKLEAFNGITAYTIYSNFINPDAVSMQHLWIKRVGHLYEIKAETMI